MKKIVSFLVLFFCCFSVFSQVRISLLFSDNFNKTGFEGVELLKQSVPGFASNNDIRMFTTDSFLNGDFSFLENSQLIFVYVHEPQIYQRALPYIKKAIAKGAKVYGMGNTPGEAALEKAGVHFNPVVQLYFAQAGKQNIKNMVLYRLDKDFGKKYTYRKPIVYPKYGAYIVAKDTIVTTFDAFKQIYPNYKKGNPWIGVYAFRYEFLNEQHAHVDQLISALENAGFNVLPIYGYPLGTIAHMVCFDKQGNSRIQALVTTAYLQGGGPVALRKLYTDLKVPVINAIESKQSEEEWRKSADGISIYERTFNLTRPELLGEIQPTVFSSRERVTNKNGVSYLEKTAIGERVKRIVDRVQAWNVLQTKKNADKKVALIYYSYPPGKENIGASYLNVFPQSMLAILKRLKQEGYNLGKTMPDSARIYKDVMDHGRNVGNWAANETARMVATGKPILVPMDTYKEWFHQLSDSLQASVIKEWGEPEKSDIMTWTDKTGKKYIVLPAVQYGNVLLTPQPARGWGQNVNKMYHDVTMPPHHQYIAFYLYLRHSFHADALIHLGTHGTLEWLNGKQAGLNDDDPPEALIGDMVDIYPYIVDDVGEGLQAKRRGSAIVIDHLTPPFDKAGMKPELRELTGLMSEYDAAKDKSATLAAAKFAKIKKLATTQGLLKDLHLDSTFTPSAIPQLEDYVEEISEKQTPMGLHTFGEAPTQKQAHVTAEAIVSRDKTLSKTEHVRNVKEIEGNFLKSGKAELDALIDALNGRYIQAAQGNDPFRNPASLPTGKDFYAFDPSKIPAADVYEKGSKLAEELVQSYRKKHDGKWPDKVTFNLWSTETIRNEGVMESQILKLMGVRPKYNVYGRVSGVELIPRRILKRPRIDVVLVPSGLYRDVFSNLMQLLDQAVSLVKKQNEADNFIREHIQETKRLLMQNGVKSDSLAERMASVRLFSVPSGAYGTGLNNVIQASGSWKNEDKVAGVFFNRMSYLYGQGFWGDKPEDKDASLPKDFSVDLLKKGLSGTKVVVHSRSSNLYGVLDNDDFFQYLGGTAMAIRSVDGKDPDVMITNLSNPATMGQETLEKYMGREMNSRYLNPKWIKAMLNEGYAGARMVNRVISNLWGWQVTVPDAVGSDKWQQVYETYVEDKYKLDIKKKFRKAGNLYAYQTAVSRMLEVARKGYWHPDKKVVQKLLKEYEATIKEIGLSCNGNVCNNSKLADYVHTELQQIKGLPPEELNRYANKLKEIKTVNQAKQSVPNAKKQIAKTKADPNFKYKPKTKVKGYQVKTVTNTKASQQPAPSHKHIQWIWYILLGIFVVSFIFGKSRK